MKAIKTQKLSFSYEKGIETLSGIDLSVEEGEFLVMMGRNGAGKSTLLLCLSGLIPNFLKGKFRGKVEVLEKDTHSIKVCDLAKEVGVMLQDFETQLFSSSVELETAFGPENFCFPRMRIEESIKNSLSLVGLEKYRARPPYTLSGGEKQKLVIGSILSWNPKILLLDEPLTDLDPLGKEDFFKILKGFKEEKRTVVAVEHETEEAVLSTRVAILDKGKVIKEGRPEEILTDDRLLESSGVRPLDIPKLFKEPILHLEEAYQRLKRLNLPEKDSPLSIPEQGEPIMEIKGLEFSYGSGFSLSVPSLKIKKGEFIAFIGANGSGKTTLAKHLNGLLYPSKGEVKVKGKDTRRWRKRNLARVVGYVFQNPDHQLFAPTVKEEVGFGPKNFGLAEEEIGDRVKEALKAIGLTGYEDNLPFSLTKGERQRVAVASILAARPEIIILDEPTTGLDYSETKGVMELLRGLNQKGYTIVVITHTIWITAEYARRAILLRDGAVVFDGDIRRLLSQKELLLKSHIRPPAITRLFNRLGVPILSIREVEELYGSLPLC